MEENAFQALVPDAYEAIRRILMTTNDKKLIKDLSRMILEGAGHLREEGQIGGQIIIRDSDVKLLIQGAKEVLGYVAETPREKEGAA